LAIGSGELPGPFYASCFSAGRLIADVVGSDDLVCDVEVARVVEEFLHLPAHHGLVLFGHRLPSFLPLSPAGFSYLFKTMTANNEPVKGGLAYLYSPRIREGIF
jgi:hypothetical protein